VARRLTACIVQDQLRASRRLTAVDDRRVKIRTAVSLGLLAAKYICRSTVKTTDNDNITTVCDAVL